MKYKKGFTLAEALLTMTVMGCKRKRKQSKSNGIKS